MGKLGNIIKNRIKDLITSPLITIPAAYIAITIPALYLVFSYATETFNPVKQIKILREIADSRENERSALDQKFNDFADTNHDGKVDNTERIRAYGTMGYGDRIHFGRLTPEEMKKYFEKTSTTQRDEGR